MAKTLEEIRQLAIDNEVKGKKFSTMAKLLNNIQIEKHDGSKYKKDIKIVECVLDYKKTGKINSKTHKVSNEIIVTDIFDEVKQYEDERYSEVSNYIYTLVKSLNSYSYTTKRIFFDEFRILSKESFNRNPSKSNLIEFYKNFLLNDFKGKLKSSMNRLTREDKLYYKDTYTFINNDNVEQPIFQEATLDQYEEIEKIKNNIKNGMVIEYNITHKEDKKEYKWNKIAYSQTNKLYEQLNKKISELYIMYDKSRIDKCIKTYTITNYDKIELDINSIKPIRDYYEKIMIEWMNKKGFNKDKDLLEYHNKLFS